jgi:phosphoribosylamine--glycine ligase
LNEVELRWKDEQAVCVILASGGYPVDYTKGYPIHGLDDLDLVFHAGTKTIDDQVVTNGGRVLGVVSLDQELSKARTKAYEKVNQIRFKDMQYRTDIAKI